MTNTYSDVNKRYETAKDAEQSNNLREIAENAGKNVREYFHGKTEQAAEMKKSAQDTITANPLKSIAIAAVGGLLLGALLRRL